MVNIDFKVTSSGRFSVKVLSTRVNYSLVAMLTHLRYLTYDLRGAWHPVYAMPCSSGIISEMLLENHSMKKRDFLKSVIHSQMSVQTMHTQITQKAI